MTRRVGNIIIIIENTDPAKCDLCGKTDELRPYGPNGENICYDCAMKDEETTDRKMHEFMGLV